jgi:hypothetical protein
MHSDATAGIVDALITAENKRTAILLMVELRKNELLRRNLKLYWSIFHCTRVADGRANGWAA